MQKIIVSDEDSGIRLDRWFKRHYKTVPFTLIARLIRKSQIRINGKRADITSKIQVGDIICFPGFEIKKEVKRKTNHDSYLVKEILKSIIYKDDEILILNKPAGLAVQGGSKINYSVDDLTEFLKFDYDEKPKLVHRLDKETSGLLILARKTNVAAKFGSMFQGKSIKKIYYALVKGVPKPLMGKVNIPLEKLKGKKFESVSAGSFGKKALTFYRVVDHVAEYALVELEIVTGRTHQIRAHLSMIGHPVIGDEKYGNRQRAVPKQMNNNLYLHAYKIEFSHKGKIRQFYAPLPKYFEDILKTFGLNVKHKL